MKTIEVPFKKGRKGNFSTLDTTALVLRQNLLTLIGTEPGTRIMEVDYGAGLKKFLFEPNDGFLHSKIQNYLKDKINKYIPELTITKLNVEVSSVNENAIYIELTCNYGIQEIVLKFKTTP